MIARSKDKLDEAKKLIDQDGGKSFSVVADAHDSASVVKAFKEIRETIGHPEVSVIFTNVLRAYCLS